MGGYSILAGIPGIMSTCHRDEGREEPPHYCKGDTHSHDVMELNLQEKNTIKKWSILVHCTLFYSLGQTSRG